MEDEINFFNILVKTLKNKAKSLTHDSGLTHNLALERISKEYGFRHWHDLSQLKSYILVHFPERPLSRDAAPLYSLLEEKGFSRISPDADIHAFIANQSLLRLFNLQVESASLGDDAETYLLRDAQYIKSLDDIKTLGSHYQGRVQYHVIYKGHLYDFDTLSDGEFDDIVEYAYFKEDGL